MKIKAESHSTSKSDDISWFVLPLIVVSQLLCTSLWFAGNAVTPDLIRVFKLSEEVLGHLTSAVQFGFISGTLIFAFLTIADRFSPSRVFMVCALLGAVSNIAITWIPSPVFILPLRFLVGFFLAGIYPVGMKIASDYHEKGLGVALGYLVGALVVGTASPHLFRDMLSPGAWREVFRVTAIAAITGGLLVGLLIKNGPYRKRGGGFEPTAFIKVFSLPRFRAAAIGYFGHMWELYAFWAFVPVFLGLYKVDSNYELSISGWAFVVIAIGGVGCVLGGYLSRQFGNDKIAAGALFISGICCLVSPFVLELSPVYFLTFLLIWGATVVADSPQFSTLVAQNSPPEVRGTALTIVNSIGFAITIISIQFLNGYASREWLFLILAPGPVFGLYFFLKEYSVGFGNR